MPVRQYGTLSKLRMLLRQQARSVKLPSEPIMQAVTKYSTAAAAALKRMTTSVIEARPRL
jgi:hypothetical protein